ncbi:GGDEF domain-containing protein [Pseudoduganella sp. SL102]|uniref:GGDEF domain-containing protein n=1 Tax=Pseudoduganella sp. SL102 TaxID=2995154 RepID=UPI00248D1D1D|nr:GGDEF domain-containing protein [Pseudoduganella sp. SL102]WBS05131.1 GGDEF domain-containing protein [Pseudoduganella sp. SL102]
MELSARALKWMHYLVGVLTCLTVGLLAWQHYGMERVVELSANGDFSYQVLDDAKDHGGSIVSHVVEGNVIKMRCTLVRKFEWPYCSIRFTLGHASHGMDMSDFDSISLDVRHRGPGPRRLRLYLRNFEQGISNLAELNSQKVNEIEFDVPENGALSVPYDLLHTATWWVKLQNRSLQESRVRLDNVTTVELSSGVANEVGQHEIDLRSIRFHGKWISQNHLLMGLTAAWFCCGIVWPLLGALHLRSTLRNREARLAALSALNETLQLETRELAGQAFLDPLTGALNRQGLRELLLKQWNRSGDMTQGVSIIFMDLDHFKSINDTFGHAAGDDVLRAFAEVVTQAIRSSDKLVRWGGEEFLIICPGTTAELAAGIAEKLRLAMSRHDWPCGLKVTASFGVTALAPREDFGEAIKRADAALYLAKSGGRDRVEVILQSATS